MRLNIKADDRMAVSLAKHNHYNALNSYGSEADKAESDVGDEIVKDAWYYLVWSFEIVNGVPTLSRVLYQQWSSCRQTDLDKHIHHR